MKTPEDCRELSSILERHASEALRNAIANAGNDRNPNLKDREIVYDLYRKIAIRDSLKLIKELRVSNDTVKKFLKSGILNFDEIK